MEDFVKTQKSIFAKIQKIQISFKKDSMERKTKEYLETRLQQLNTLWSAAVDGNDAIEEYRTINPSHVYFSNKCFETLETLTEEVREQLENALRDALRRTNESNLIFEQHRLITKQLELMSSFKRMIAKSEDGLDSEQSMAFFAQTIKLIDDYWGRLMQNHMEIVGMGKRRDSYFDQNMFNDIEEQYHAILIKLQEKCLEIGADGKSSDTNVSQIKTIKLPQVEVPKFGGDYLQWKAFRDLFMEVIHSNESIGKAQKLYYLKLNLNGEPYELIRHLQVTSENYETAWEILDRRFNNKRILVNAQLMTILAQPDVSKEAANSIKRLHDVTNECLLAIKNLGVDTKGWDPMLILLLTQKLDKETHRLYEQSLKSPRELQTVQEFFTFLENRFQTLEALEVKGKPNDIRQVNSVKAYYNMMQLMCPICQQSHKVYRCEKFTKMTVQQRLDATRAHKLCDNCLVAGHFASKCKSWSKCKICQKRHNTLLHKEECKQYQGEFSKGRVPKSDKSVTNDVMCHFGSKSNITSGQVLLPTAVVQAQHRSGRFVELRALIDQGSEATFISEDAVQRLELLKQKTHALISGVGNTNSAVVKTHTSLTLRPRFLSSFVLHTNALILSKLTGLLPSGKITSLDKKCLAKLQLADDGFDTPSRIDVILGADVIGEIMLNDVKKMPFGKVIAQNTEFGWILSGGLNHQVESATVQCFVTEIDIDKQLNKFWESEEVVPEKVMTTEDIECEMHYKSNYRRSKDGRYTVRIPLRADPLPITELQGSRELALARLFQLERKFKTDSQLERMYKDFIHEYIRLGHMVPAFEDASPKHYLPHHAVFKHDSTTTKLRVVFDASVKRNTTKSLNDVMMTGPNLQQNLMDLLLRWQKYKIVFLADVEKMYRQIKVDIRDQDLQRILWRDTPREPIKEYKLTTVTYGTAAAPFLAIRTLRQLAIDDGIKFPVAAKVILRDTYMDDIVSGADSFEEAYTTCDQLIRLLKGGGFNLRKWNSNDARLLRRIPDELRDSANNIKFDEGETIKALGVHWDPRADQLKIRVNILPDPVSVTKRSILSEAAKVFDPTGLLSPVTVKIKLLFQQLWLQEIEWDEPIPHTIQNEWRRVKHNLLKLERIEIPRWIGYSKSNMACEIHGFSDASEKAYSAAVYIRTITQSGEVYIRLLAAKTKVSPLRTKITLPRLELNGALLLSRLIKEVKKSLDIEDIKCYAWTDSTVVLAWLKANPHRWTTYVGNRVAEIQSIISFENWFHVRSEANPADIASRGCYPEELPDHKLWWNGPKWLQSQNITFPEMKVIDTELEVNSKVKVNSTRIEKVESAILEQLLMKYSSLTKLLRVTAYCYRFIYNTRCDPINRRKGPLTVFELNTALVPLLRITQYQHFKADIQRLAEKKPVTNDSRLLTLSPILDENGIIRVRGRLGQSCLTFDQKFPIILPHKSDLTTLVIDQAHLKTLHGGAFKTLEFIQQKYWILNQLKAVKGRLHRCVICHRFSARFETQLMGELPRPRVTATRPFTNSGVDYAGPFTLRPAIGRSVKTFKGYIALFVCLSTKAIHLEVVSDLTAKAFIAAVNRFVSRRGAIANMYSDNATNFVKASKLLAEALRSQDFQTEVATALASENIQWHFIPPSSPHFGGLWEAGIKSTKNHMKRIVGETILTFEELTTLTAMIEACLNSRPLCPLTNDFESLEVLTPGHFLIGSPLLSLPQQEHLETNPNLLQRWELIERMHQQFWKQWSSEYLSRLQQRPKWMKERPNLQIGCLVLIKEDNLPPTRWLLGRIIAVHPGTDGLIRVVTVKTKTSVMKRPIRKLSLLPLEDNDNLIRGEVNESATSSNDELKANKEENSKQVNSTRQNKKGDTYSRKRKLCSNHGKAEISRQGKRNSPNRSCQVNFGPSWCFSSMLLLMLSFLLVLVCGNPSQKAYSITPFNSKQGIYFEDIAEANLYSNEWTLIVHYNLTTYFGQLDRIETAVSQLNSICNTTRHKTEFKDHCEATTTQLRRHLDEIEDASQLIYQPNGHARNRRRTPLFGFVGSVANTLFGVLDQNDAEEYEKQICKLNENKDHLTELLKKQTSIADSTLNIIKVGHDEARQQYLTIKRHLSAIQDENNRVQEELKLYASFDSAALLITLDISSISHVQQAILSVLSQAHHGKISTLLISPAQLRTQLQLVQQHLTPNSKIPEIEDESQPLTLYKLMEPRARIVRNSLICEIKIPLLEAEHYKIYRMIPIPIDYEVTYLYIQPSSSYLLVNNHRDRYSPMSERDLTLCRTWNQGRFLCKSNLPLYNLRSNVSKCEIELLTLDGALSTACSFRKTIKKQHWIEMHTTNSWIFILPRNISLVIVCGNSFQQVKISGSGIFQLQPGCLVKHPTMFLTASSKITGNIETSFMVEARIPVNLNSTDLGKATKQLPVPTEDIVSLKLNSIQSAVNDQKNELNSTPDFNYHDLHHYVVIYVILSAAVIVTIVYCIRKYKFKTINIEDRLSSETKPDKMQMTNASDFVPIPTPRQHEFGC